MKIYIGSDHAGFEMKKVLVSFLIENGFNIYDCGPKEYIHDDDYPDYISIVAKHVSKEINAKGIIIGWSGQGEAMVANRFPNVRCAVFYGGSKHVLTLSREHNDANILSLGAHFITTGEAKQAMELWLGTKFSNEERHMRRIKKIEKYDNS
ncbi:MAG: RpiB/LacA/LacB family sugar-phosphate isomerase [Candidatus Zambryskibacteria bacterium]|nr:RpiB/LacA/LacB family sugar-phosphate isomerase [Candidatus Zambryskibacteria bacterium]